MNITARMVSGIGREVMTLSGSVLLILNELGYEWQQVGGAGC